MEYAFTELSGYVIDIVFEANSDEVASAVSLLIDSRIGWRSADGNYAPWVGGGAASTEQIMDVTVATFRKTDEVFSALETIELTKDPASLLAQDLLVKASFEYVTLKNMLTKTKATG